MDTEDRFDFGILPLIFDVRKNGEEKKNIKMTRGVDQNAFSATTQNPTKNQESKKFRPYPSTYR